MSVCRRLVGRGWRCALVLQVVDVACDPVACAGDNMRARAPQEVALGVRVWSTALAVAGLICSSHTYVARQALVGVIAYGHMPAP